MAAAYAIISGGGSNKVPMNRAGDIAIMSALAAWRVTKGIYRFDEELLVALLDTPIDGQLPTDVLYRLPEWCIYVETGADRPVGGASIHGFFAHLEWDPSDERVELRLLLDLPGDGLLAIPIHLTGGTLADAIKAAQDESVFQQAAATPMSSEQLHDLQGQMDDSRAPLQEIVAPVVSTLLYLCTENADVAQEGREPATRAPRSRSHAAQSPMGWDVGFRVGAALRRAQTVRGEPQGGHHASPRAHVRRAHWHTFWRGPRGNQTPVLKWLSPILVGADSEEDLVTTVHPVEKG
jgi:hypothetical protein